MRSEKVRLLVLSVFLVALIVFAVVYQPVDAMSHPSHSGSVTVVPAAQ